ncbi:MAG TPA: SpoIIE family protein phosphatase [Methylomirabilota bacterium]|nr:SpoIIE family protein phosphatase [Methylomirabilota bacterium]
MYPSFDGDRAPVAVSVTDASGVSAARRSAAALTRAAGFGETEAGRLAIVVTEAATNLLKHGDGGEVLLETVTADAGLGVQMLALDRGRGMASVAVAARDGYSTAGTAGTGLGAIGRQADLCEIQSLPGHGTVVLAQVWARTPAPTHGRRVSVGAACAPGPGEDVSGDGWAVIQHSGRTVVLVVDGLGHGPIAADARRQAIRIFQSGPSAAPADLVSALHAGLRSTRGAAVAVADIDPERRCLRFCGLGNIGAAVLSGGGRRSLVSHNGTAGHAARKIDEFTYPWPDDAVLVAHTDGLVSHWSLDAYPGLTARHPSLLAGVLYRDFKRGRDDVTVVVARALPR